MEKAWFAAIAFLFGSLIGSFLNVVIYRLPLGISIVTPRSRCPRCQTPIAPWHNVPILSYLLLRGKCARCGERISARYPLVELLTALAWAGIALKGGQPAKIAADILLITVLIAVTFIDIDHKIIPDSMSLGSIPVGLAFSLLTPLGIKASLLGLLIGGGSLWAVAEGYRILTKREGMGFGDVKLLGAIGAFLGWQAVLFTIIVSSVVGAVAGVVIIRLAKGGRHMEIPYGPFLSLGAALYIYMGPQIVAWYLGSL